MQNIRNIIYFTSSPAQMYPQLVKHRPNPNRVMRQNPKDRSS